MTNQEKGWYRFLSDFGIDPSIYIEVKDSFSPVKSHVEKMVSGKDYWQVSPDELNYIFSATKLLRPEKVVETGVGPGTTSYAFLSAMSDFDGKLYSFDLGIRYGESDHMPVGFVVPQEMRSAWTLTIGDSMVTLLPVLRKISPIDIFFHDSDHTYNHVMFEMTSADRSLKKRGLIVVDNYDWSRAPEDFAKEYGYKLVPIVDDLAFLYKL
ncbi:MAG: class I SAM-dependent methyltransferase [Thermoplasmata archaeon]